MNARPRVLVLVREFPQISQTYIKNELETLARDYELSVIGLGPANVAEPEHLPHRITHFREDIVEVIKSFKPQLIHCHYLLMVPVTAAFAEEFGLPFTVRTHPSTSWRPAATTSSRNGRKRGNTCCATTASGCWPSPSCGRPWSASASCRRSS